MAIGMLQRTFRCIHLLELLFSFSSDKYLEGELLDPMVVLFLICFVEIHTVFHSDCIVTFSPIVHKCFLFSTSSPSFVISYLLIVSILRGVRWYFIVGLICISLMIGDITYLFMKLLAMSMSSLEKCLFRSDHFLNWIIFFLWSIWVIYVSFLSTPYKIYNWQVFLPSVGCLFILLIISFVLQKFLSLM